jgi:hypothetical protein
MRLVKYIIVFFIVIFACQAYGHHGVRRTNSVFNYKDHVYEFGYSVNLSYMRYEKSFAPQFQMHFAHYLTRFFSLGVGYSAIFGQNFYNTFTFEPTFRVFDNVLFNFKPGMLLKTTSNQTILQYYFGCSSTYEFKVTDNMHIGPKAEIAIFQDDINYVVGFHMGFSF